MRTEEKHFTVFAHWKHDRVVSEQPPKLIFAGLDKAGKTTIYRATMEEMTEQELMQNQKPTRGIERHSTDFLDRDFSVWDLGGQQNYRDMYLSKPEVFNLTKAMIFVVDIQDTDRFNQAYQYYLDILNILKNVDPAPKLYVLFHKYDPEIASKLKAHFYRAARLFRKADSLTNQKFKGYATSIYSNSIDLAVKRILFENFEDYIEPTGTVRARSKAQSQSQSAEPSPVPTPGGQTPAKSPTKMAEKTKIIVPQTKEEKKDEPVTGAVFTPPPSTAPKTGTPSPVPSIETKTVVSEPETKEEEIEEALIDATPTKLFDLSEDVIERLTNIVNKRMKESDELVALSIMAANGDQVMAIGKSEIDYTRLETLKEVVKTLNPELFFKDLTDIEYRGLGHFSLDEFDIYFARASDDYAIAVLATDVSTPMLQNAQRIVRSIRQGLGMVDDDDDLEDIEEEEPATKKKDLVSDLRSRLKALSGLDDLN